MIHLALLLTLATLPNQGQPQAAPAPLKHVYAATDLDRYRLEFRIEVGDGIEIKSDVIEKVNKLLDGGKSNLTLTVDHYTSGLDSASDAPEPFTGDFDEHGVSTQAIAGDSEIIYFLFELANNVPGNAISAGESYKVDFKVGAKAISIKGKCKELKVIGGSAVALLEWSAAMETSTSDLMLDGKSQVDVVTGKLIKSDVDFTQGTVTGKIKVVAIKKP